MKKPSAKQTKRTPKRERELVAKILEGELPVKPGRKDGAVVSVARLRRAIRALRGPKAG